jgi:hypothetical protein
MVLEVIPDTFDNANHDRMDEAVKDTVDELFSPTFLLATIVSTSDGILDPKYEKIQNAKALLRECPELANKLKEAWNQGTFKEIRKLSTLQCLFWNRIIPFMACRTIWYRNSSWRYASTIRKTG